MIQQFFGRSSSSLPVVCLFGLLSAAGLSGCSVFTKESDSVTSVPDQRIIPEIASARSRLVAKDLVSVLTQIPGSEPNSRPLLFSLPQSNYGRVLAAELQRAGYDLRVSDNRVADRYLSYSIKPSGARDTRSYLFTVSVGRVKVKREYTLDRDRIYPVSSVYVAGASPEGVVVDEALFSESTLYAVPLKKQPVVTPQASISGGSTLSQSQPAGKAPAVQEGVGVPETAPDVAAVDKAQPGKTDNGFRDRVLHKKDNMYKLRRSNFKDVLSGYEDVRKEILVFGNDSVLLGRRNKRIARDLIREFNENTDVISVIGCSHGNTEIDDGNRKLALGRSSRVREELILGGINPGYVFDEGCWSPEYFDEVMPRRGVVVTLKRIRGTS